MKHGADGVTVVSILGEDYSIKAPAGQEQALLDAAAMLKAALADTKEKIPDADRRPSVGVGGHEPVFATDGNAEAAPGRTRPLSRAGQRHGRCDFQDYPASLKIM
ncbi:Z ring-associated protein ZapA (modular protein) [Pseudomonas mediterranea]